MAEETTDGTIEEGEDEPGRQKARDRNNKCQDNHCMKCCSYQLSSTTVHKNHQVLDDIFSSEWLDYIQREEKRLSRSYKPACSLPHLETLSTEYDAPSNHIPNANAPNFSPNPHHYRFPSHIPYLIPPTLV
jgi:hypothetical protein